MLYVKIDNMGVPIERPITLKALEGRLKNVILPKDLNDEILKPFGFACVPEMLSPERKSGHALVLGIPKRDDNGNIIRTWEHIPYTEKGLKKRQDELREKRNKLLEETDWTQNADVQNTLSSVDKQKLIEYRASLRNLISDYEDPNLAKYPEKPLLNQEKLNTSSPEELQRRMSNAYFQDKTSEGVSYMFPDGISGNIQTRGLKDIVNILSLSIQALISLKLNLNKKFNFRDENDVEHPMSADEILLMSMSVLGNICNLYEKKWKISKKLSKNKNINLKNEWSN